MVSQVCAEGEGLLRGLSVGAWAEGRGQEGRGQEVRGQEESTSGAGGGWLFSQLLGCRAQRLAPSDLRAHTSHPPSTPKILLRTLSYPGAGTGAGEGGWQTKYVSVSPAGDPGPAPCSAGSLLAALESGPGVLARAARTTGMGGVGQEKGLGDYRALRPGLVLRRVHAGSNALEFFLFSSFFRPPLDTWNSQARSQIPAVVVTCTLAPWDP